MSIHDAMFKVFREVQVFISLLKFIFPPDLFNLVIIDSIKFIDRASTGKHNKDKSADLVVEIKIKGIAEPIVVYLIFEHKSINDPEAILQLMGYYSELCQRTKGIVIPIILVCSKDGTCKIPSDYLTFALRKYRNIPQPLVNFLAERANFRCLVLSINDLNTKTTPTDEPASIVFYAMSNFWRANKKHVSEIIKKSSKIPRKTALLLISKLMNYYENTDMRLGSEAFDEAERSCFPNLKEEDRLMPEILLGRERYLAEGFAKGFSKGRDEGFSEGQEELILRMLASGIVDDIILDIAKINREQLAIIKEKIPKHSNQPKQQSGERGI